MFAECLLKAKHFVFKFLTLLFQVVRFSTLAFGLLLLRHNGLLLEIVPSERILFEQFKSLL